MKYLELVNDCLTEFKEIVTIDVQIGSLMSVLFCVTQVSILSRLVLYILV